MKRTAILNCGKGLLRYFTLNSEVKVALVRRLSGQKPFPCVLVRFLYCSKHRDQSQPGRKGLLGLHFPITGLHAGNWRQKLKQKPWRNTAYWIVPLGSLSLLSYTTQAHPLRDEAAHSGLGTSYQSSIEKVYQRFACRPSDGDSSSAEAFLPKDRKLTRTPCRPDNYVLSPEPTMEGQNCL